MGKKKKKQKGLLSIAMDPPQSTDDSFRVIRKVGGNTPEIIEERLAARTIPKIDDGIKDKDLKNPPPDVLEKWYQEAHVGEYVHMERAYRHDGRSYTTKRIQFEFSRMLQGYDSNLNEQNVNPVIASLSFATIKKISFLNNIGNPLRYINYFIEYFDDDDELMRAYFYVMFQIMSTEVDLDPQSFIEAVYASFTTDTMIEKLIRMIEHNTDESLIKKTDRVYDESIQLTVEHLKAIMGVSCLHKFAIPLVSHYFDTRTQYLEEAGMSDKDLYYYLFTSFIPVFDEHYDICLYNKLYHTSTTRITKTTNQESLMWERRRQTGTTPTSYTHALMRDFVIDISQKGVFGKSAIIFIHVCMDRAIKTELIQPDKFDFSEMPMVASDSVNETISKWDRYQTEKAYHSEKDRIRAIVSVKESLLRMGKEFEMDFEKMKTIPRKGSKPKSLKEEYRYYRESLPQPLSSAQSWIINLYYSTWLANTRDTDALEPKELLQLIMVMKRDLRARNYNYLPFFISGRVDVAAGKKYNRRRIEKLITTHPLYPDWVAQFPDTDELLNREKIYGEIKTIVACPIEVVDYEHIDMRGGLMRPVEVCVVDEIMRFLVTL